MKKYRPKDSLIYSDDIYIAIIDIALELDLVKECEHEKYTVTDLGMDTEYLPKLLEDTYSEIDLPVAIENHLTLLDNIIMFLNENMSSCKICM